MKKETKIEIFFWLVVLFVFSPRILLEVYEKKLRDSLTPFENNEWTVKDKVGNVIYDKLTLPFDLRWKEQKTNRREWIFEKEIRTDHLKNVDDLGIVLGRIADSDYVMFNDCFIGSTGVDPQTKKVDGWGWSQVRKYQIPKNCIKIPYSLIKVRIFKVFGPGYGVYAGTMGIGNFHEIQEIGKLIDFFKYIIPTVFGLGLIFFIGVHYLFIFLVSEKRQIYGIFSLLSISVGVFLFITGLIPFLFANFAIITTKLLFISAFSASFLFLLFFDKKFKIFNQKLLCSYVSISFLILFFALFKKDPEKVYQYYEYWHPVFLVTFIVCYIQMFLFKFKNKNNIYFNKYLLAFSIFVLCCIHDVIVSIFVLSNSYLIGYAYTFFAIVVGLTLSREYSDAFFKIEDQVIERTKELKLALTEIEQIQILKDEQARSFAHDIRSPLLALQVLKDLVSKSLSDDQRSLLKHTIVRINDLANTVLPKTDVSSESEISSVFLWPLVDKLVSEKKLEYQHIPNLLVETKCKSVIFDLYVSANESDLSRILSNLVNNAIEAKYENRHIHVQITLESHPQWIEIDVIDNGIGVQKEVLDKIFDRGFSIGKKDGMGLGLANAKKVIESWGGNIVVESTLGSGSIFKIRLPMGVIPPWLTTKLQLQNIDDLVIIDDQPYVIDAWRQKLEAFDKTFRIHWIQNLEDWKQRNTKDGLDYDRTMFLVDYDLSSNETGIDMIEELRLFPNIHLVTANEDDTKLRTKVMSLGITILPKSLIYAVDILV